MSDLSVFAMRPLDYQKNGLRSLTSLLPSGIVMAEIGCYMGESTCIFLDTEKVIKIYCVDPWVNGYDEADEASHRCDMAAIEGQFDVNVAKYEHKCQKLKKKSVEAAAAFPDHTLDFVYIDGMHTYEAVKADIAAWKSKIKPGGYIGGHDYGMSGINQAISEELGSPLATFEDLSWIVKL